MLETISFTKAFETFLNKKRKEKRITPLRERDRERREKERGEREKREEREKETKRRKRSEGQITQTIGAS